MKRIIFIFLILLIFLSLIANEQVFAIDGDKTRNEKWGAVDLMAHLLMANGDMEEIAFAGISANCDA